MGIGIYTLKIYINNTDIKIGTSCTMKKGRREQIVRTNHSTRVCGATVKIWRFFCNHQLKHKLPFSKETKSVLKTLKLQCKSWTDSVLIDNYCHTTEIW